MLNRFWLKFAVGAAAVSSLVISASAAQAIEIFSIDNVALNTNTNFRRINGQPRMAIWERNPNDNDPDQQFDIFQGNKGGSLLKHGSTGMCLNAYNPANGSEINVWNCNADDPDQNWDLIDVGDGRKLIKRTGTPLCVDTPTRDNGGKVHLWTCDSNNPNQRWRSSAATSPPGSNPILIQQGVQYFKDRPQFYGTQGNGYAYYGYGSSLLGTNHFGIEGNCVWYAYGRLKELGFNPGDIMSGFPNANQWGSVLRNGARNLGSGETPQFGDVAQWYLNGRNHVAVVEKVEGGYVYLSESHWGEDFDGDLDNDGISAGDGTLHRTIKYSVTNPQRYIRLMKP
ncbi:ricin-type beta-trefoil lectin domain protein [Trichocoleus sp. DQ-A3]|uniref:ricin-type beta-trefoil lectin domain protein n=1 Tax=Cyanophyceae TaxID=3028117 RepID=UPI001685E43B|nr:ricin-type beta-trefoil lectin domain protein [Coleofasciculus sp. FACHB-125]MBD1902053.1 ricin-type beta-trefoil lectin domain protein [Coleofasciculus sp. FACHB-125]